MDIKNREVNTAKPPIQVLQYGEGKFLRAFADYFIDIANESGVFFGSVAVVQPISSGNLQPFKEQDNKYTVILRGKENGKKIDDSRLITCISKTLSCYENYDEYIALAELDSLKFIISNTTEAGIALHLDDDLEKIPSSFPGKLTQFLYRRYQIFHGDLKKGFIILPVELIDDNGSKLKEYVICLAEHNNYPREFIDCCKSCRRKSI